MGNTPRFLRPTASAALLHQKYLLNALSTPQELYGGQGFVEPCGPQIGAIVCCFIFEGSIAGAEKGKEP